jgi:hypothetical protein
MERVKCCENKVSLRSSYLSFSKIIISENWSCLNIRSLTLEPVNYYDTKPLLYNFTFKFFQIYHFWKLIFVFLNIRSRPRALPRFVLASQPISLTASNRWKKFRVKVYWVGPSPPTLSITTRKTGWIRSETFIRFEDQNSWQNKLNKEK